MHLTANNWKAQNDKPCGGIAQLGERLHGMQEVSGSIPLTSTKNLASRLKIDFIGI